MNYADGKKYEVEADSDQSSNTSNLSGGTRTVRTSPYCYRAFPERVFRSLFLINSEVQNATGNVWRKSVE